MGKVDEVPGGAAVVQGLPIDAVICERSGKREHVRYAISLSSVTFSPQPGAGGSRKSCNTDRKAAIAHLAHSGT